MLSEDPYSALLPGTTSLSFEEDEVNLNNLEETTCTNEPEILVLGFNFNIEVAILHYDARLTWVVNVTK